ncbi:MAG: hypothetical protein U1E67_08035 [Hyphomicrobiales bacterium]
MGGKKSSAERELGTLLVVAAIVLVLVLAIGFFNFFLDAWSGGQSFYRP